MSVSPDILIGPRLKVERADCHIDELRRLTQPLHPSLYEIVVEEHREFAIEAKPSAFQLIYRPKKPIPETLAVVIGDAIHNLRSALDHVAGGIIRTLENPPKFKPYFPIHPKRENLKSDASLKAIEQALPGAEKLLLEEIRPANGPNEKLWSFNDLSNLDKHNLIIPTVTFARVADVNVTVGTNRIDGACIGGNAARQIGLIRSSTPMEVHNDLNAAVEITFDEGDHGFGGEPAIPTLLNIAEVVTETINAFERLIRA